MKTTANTSQDTFGWSKGMISHRALLAKKLAPLKYLVEDLLITPGLAVLAGKKKMRKSWLALQLAQCVASGGPFLGKATRRGGVLYLALEDGERRLKDRLQKQKTRNDLPIDYKCEWKPLNDEEGFEALEEAITVLAPALVIIDSLTSAKDKHAKENEADSMGDLFNGLHGLAVKANTTILIVAHHGKAKYEDVGFDIRGSSAMPSPPCDSPVPIGNVI